jgi:hypothetical protein
MADDHVVGVSESVTGASIHRSSDVVLVYSPTDVSCGITFCK